MKERKEKPSKDKSKSLKPLRIKISKILERGHNSIRFKPEFFKKLELEETKGNSNKLAREVCAESKKYLRVIPKKKRLYKIHYTKKKLVKSNTKEPTARRLKYENLRKDLKIKDIYKDLRSLSYVKKEKLKTDKQIHMEKIRNLRMVLKENKKFLKNSQYRQIYLKIKGAFFKGNLYNSRINLLNTINQYKKQNE